MINCTKIFKLVRWQSKYCLETLYFVSAYLLPRRDHHAKQYPPTYLASFVQLPNWQTSLSPYLAMVYIAQWDEFSVSSERLFLASPLKVRSLPLPCVLFQRLRLQTDIRRCLLSLLAPQTRFSFKYRSSDGNFVLKVTNDKTVSCTPTQEYPLWTVHVYTRLTDHRSCSLCWKHSLSTSYIPHCR